MRKIGMWYSVNGGGALLNAIKEYTEYKTGLSVRIGNPEEKVEHQQDMKINNPIYSTALGLMVMGIEKTKKMMLCRKIRRISSKIPFRQKKLPEKNLKKRKLSHDRNFPHGIN